MSIKIVKEALVKKITRERVGEEIDKMMSGLCDKTDLPSHIEDSVRPEPPSLRPAHLAFGAFFLGFLRTWRYSKAAIIKT